MAPPMHHRTRKLSLALIPVFLFVALPALGSGCAGRGAPIEFLDGPPPPPPVELPPPVAEMPPQVFTPAVHAARVHPVVRTTNFGALPRMEARPSCSTPPAFRPRKPIAANSRPGTASKSTKKKSPPRRPPAAGMAANVPAMESEDSAADLDDVGMEPTGGALGTEAPAASRAEISKAKDREAKTADRTRGREQRKAERRRNRDASATPADSASVDAGAFEQQNDFDGGDGQIAVAPVIEFPPEGEGWGDATYLSNDDTMSLSSAQRVIFAIDGFLPLPLAHIRSHELLNYFDFEKAPVDPEWDFSVKADLGETPDADGRHTLTLSVAGRHMPASQRRNVALTVAIDVSGSMKEEGKMEFLKRGLMRMVRELQPGDMVNLVTFQRSVCQPLRHFVVGRDDPKSLVRAIHALRPKGNTNLHAGLNTAYALADASYQNTHSNRVLLITDALANEGVTDESMIAEVGDWYDRRRIRLSGIGVGRDFNDGLLDRLTERGRGAYVFLGSGSEVDAIFGSHFTSLVETVANDVHFRLHLPSSLRMTGFRGEQASTQKSEVQAVHFFANTSQLFLAQVEPWRGDLREQDGIMLEIEYLDPESGDPRKEEFAFTMGEIKGTGRNIHKATMLTAWIDGIRQLAARDLPRGWQPRPRSWQDFGAAQLCRTGKQELARLGAPVQGDPEVRRVMELWDRYCERFDASRPARKEDRPSGGWPGAR